MDENFDSRIEESQNILNSAIAQTMIIYGFTPSVGRIYSTLYFAEEPLNLDEIKDVVSMSKGSVSTGIRVLLDTELTTKVWKAGDRKDYFIAEKDFFQNFFTFFTKMLRQERNTIAKANEKARATLEEIESTSESEEARRIAKKDLDEIKRIDTYIDWTSRLVHTMESGEIFNFVPKYKQGENHNGTN